MKKKAKVVMLPTKEKTNIILSKLYLYHYTDNEIKQQIEKYGADNLLNPNESFQYLYITSDEEIKEGEYFIHYYSKEIFKCLKIDIENNLILCKEPNGRDTSCFINLCNKIVATTDPSLNLPRPSNEFIKKYCELNGEIEDILVEYSDLYQEFDDKTKYNIRLKIAPDNTISIYPYKN